MSEAREGLAALRTGRRRRNRLRPDARRRARRRPGAGRAAGGGAGLLHPPVRGARARGVAARAPDRLRGALPDDACRIDQDRTAVVTEAHAVGDLTGLVARLDALARWWRSSAPHAGRAATAERETKAAKEQFVAEAERLAPATTGVAGSTGSGRCWTSGRRSPGSTGPPTTSCGTGSPRARTTYTRRRKAQFAAAERPARDRPARSRNSWSPRPRRWRLDRLGADDRRLPRPDDPLEGGRTGAAGGRRGAVEAVPRRPGHVLRGQAGGPTPQDRSSGPTRRPRRSCSSRREALSSGHAIPAPPGPRTATCWSAGPRSARSRGTPIRPLDNRLRAVETAISDAEDDRWRRTNPEARARPRRPRPSSRRRSPR